MKSKVSTKLGIIYYLAYNGYYRFIDSKIYVHRWVAKKMLGRKLYDWEEVHHLDGVKTNNQFYNLFVCSKEKHKQIHQDNITHWGDWNGPDFNYPNS